MLIILIGRGERVSPRANDAGLALSFQNENHDIVALPLRRKITQASGCAIDDHAFSVAAPVSCVLSGAKDWSYSPQFNIPVLLR
jgi:hypothetical protein